jgi:glyoxylase-like metal-dependent hydrolase (beta-lactamase superfamily II)
LVSELTRREFLAQAGSCSAHLALAAAGLTIAQRAAWAQVPHGALAAREPFGSLEKVADGVWALISTPLTGDRTTLSNGGFIAGRTGVIAVEGFNQPAGAAWLAARAKELSGRWPTHVVLTHYHSDHANGVAGYVQGGEKPVVRATATTKGLVLEKNLPADPSRTAALADAVLVDGAAPTAISLGDRTVRITPSLGHTASDVFVTLEGPDVTFGGDLVWNGMFPNYVDAVPSKLAASVRALPRSKGMRYVPGHGAMADVAALDRYTAMLDEVEQSARRFHRDGRTAAEAGAGYALPAAVGEWVLFNKVFFERAFSAWYKELGAAR